MADEANPLHAAVAAGRTADVANLLAGGADVNALDARGVASLHIAAAGGNALLAAFVKPAEMDLSSLEATPADVPFVEIATALIDGGADPNLTAGPACFTPLMIATCFGRRDLVELLCARGADPNLRDVLGRTAERFAVFPLIGRLIRLCRRLEMVRSAHVAQIHAPATHQFTSSAVGLDLTAPLPGDAFADWPIDQPLVAFGLGEDAISRLVRLTPAVYARTIEVAPRGPFIRTFTFRFDDKRPPYERKFAVEKQIEALLPLDRSTTTPLAFRGRTMFSGVAVDVTLVFESTDGATRSYALHATASAAAGMQSADGFDRAVRAVEGSWRKLLSAREAGPAARGEHYAAEVREAIELEAQAIASRREDPAKIQALQREFLEAMATGRTLRTWDKDGGTELRWVDGRGVLEEHNHRDTLDYQEFTNSDEFLACARRLYAWEIGRESAPHPPLESCAWEWLIRRLHGR